MNLLLIVFINRSYLKIILFVNLNGVLQITGETIGEVKAVANMHQRKAEMARHSDCFIALPGPTPPPLNL